MPEQLTGVARCGGMSVRWDNTSKRKPGGLGAWSGEVTSLQIPARDGLETVVPLWCGDITGDGKVELVSERFTGGAHCCFSVRVDTLPGGKILEADLGNASHPTPVQLDDSLALELQTSSDVLAYIGDLPYAASPTLPRIIAFRERRYVDATSDFTDYIRGSLEDARIELKSALVDGDETDVVKGLAIGLFGHYVLLGDAEDGLEQTARLVPDEIGDWLRYYAEEAARLVRDGGRNPKTAG
jgi:hypothetical protein